MAHKRIPLPVKRKSCREIMMTPPQASRSRIIILSPESRGVFYSLTFSKAFGLAPLRREVGADMLTNRPMTRRNRGGQLPTEALRKPFRVR